MELPSSSQLLLIWIEIVRLSNAVDGTNTDMGAHGTLRATARSIARKELFGNTIRVRLEDSEW